MKRNSKSFHVVLSLRILLIGWLVAGGIFAGQPAPTAQAALQYYARDLFDVSAYNNQDGSVNWAANWVETDDAGGGATGGNVSITGGELRITNRTGQALENIQRKVAYQPGTQQVTLAFDFRTPDALTAADSFVIDVSANGGGNWTTLETITDDAQGSRVYNISAYLTPTSNTFIRLRVGAGYTDVNDAFLVNALRVTYFVNSIQTLNQVVQTVQTYYIPVPEDQLNTINTTIYNYPGTCPNSQGIFNPGQPLNTYVSIAVVTTGTVIYFDHWEDGFETEINLPAQATSEVWGDNNPANGTPPGISGDTLQAGAVILLKNPVQTATRQTIIDYDGGDKLGSTEPIAVTHLSWNSGSDTLLATAEEMLDTSVWGSQYDIPVGPNVDTARQVFEYNRAVVMAAQDNTKVYLNGTLVSTINQGKSYLTTVDLNPGDSITTSGPVQVTLYTGDVCANFESRSYTLYPTELWSSNYYNPVSTGGAYQTSVILFNPDSSPLSVNWSTSAGPQPVQVIPARGTMRVVLPNNVGSRFYSSGEPFFALAAVDANAAAAANQTFDWGYTLIPSNQLTQQALVGFGIGRDPTKSSTENGAPVWVTAALPPGMSGTAPFEVCVDNNGDGLGALTDRNGHHYDQLVTLTELQQARVYDPDGDQTGMLLYVCGANDGDARIAVAWGEDPEKASAGAPGFDGGTSVPPLPNFVSVKGARITHDALGNDQFDVGDAFNYDIVIKNAGALPISSGAILVSDIIPPYTFYVPGSTTFFNGSTTVSVPDDLLPATLFPLDGPGYTVPQSLPINGQFTVSFQVRINTNIPGSVRVQNQARVSGLNLLYDPNVEIVINAPDLTRGIGDFVWNDLNNNGLQDTGEPGIEGVLVELQDGLCTPGLTCLTDVTDSSGLYFFPSLAYGDYQVSVISDLSFIGLTQSGDPDAACPSDECDQSHSVTLTALNAPYLAADFGYYGNLTGSLGDRVWNDFNANGLQDSGENGIANVTVWADLNNNGLQDSGEPNTLTAANGSYHLTGLAAGSYVLRVAGAAISGASATYDLDGIASPNAATLTLNGGQNRSDVDFGYRFAALDINKTSSAAGLLLPGDTVLYSIVVRNNTAARQTKIAISDSLPAGTSYVAGSSRVSGFTDSPYTRAYTDDFRAQVYNNILPSGQAWAGTWVEVGETTNPTGNQAQVVTDSGRNYVLRPGNNTGGAAPANRSVYRTAGILSDCSSVTLAYNYRPVTLEAADHVYVELSADGGTNWTTVRDISNANSGTYLSSGNIDGSAYRANLGLRFRTNFNDINQADVDTIYFDDVAITCYGSTITTVTNQAAGTPPALVAASSGFTLDPGQSMTISYRVTVNNPLTAGVTNITNTAAVTSSQQPNPQSASTIDRLPNFAIGNRVWLDEDSDGAQDPGEDGLANVRMLLWDSTHTNLLAVTTTDLTGGYLFAGLLPNTYQVQVDPASLPAGLQPTTNTPGTGDWLSHDQPYSASLTSGGDHLSADFGYNWAAPADVTGNTGSGAIGDRVWIDANGNGRQDAGEAGLANVTVLLLDPGPDGLLNTPDDVLTETFTDAAGYYIFKTLSAGTYLVGVGSDTSGYTQTGDPDDFGTPCTVCDQMTSTPVLLGPGDVFVNVDFGFQPNAGSSAIGSLIFFDRNANGSFDGLDYGISGVSVSLIDDANGNGLHDDGEAVIANTLTGSTGEYRFSGLPAGNYLVWVNDSANRLANTEQRVDPDGGNDRLSHVTLDGSSDNLVQNHGFSAAGHTSGAGLIGNRIFLDRDGNGTAGSGEALEGIKVTLYNASGSLALASTYTNAAGEYVFGNLPAGTYQVKVETSTLPVGVTNTTDPDYGSANQSTVTIGAGQSRLDQNFGYRAQSPSNTIGGTLWRDDDADGLLDAEETTRFGGVKLSLLDASGDSIASTISDGSGNFSFPGLPNGSYTVVISDDSGQLRGTWLTSGLANTDNNSQKVAYTVSVANGQVNTTADFGFTRAMAALGNRVWVDDGDGLQESGEPGLPNVTVQLSVRYPNGTTVILRTVTDENGEYSFANLLHDEAYNGSSASEPVFTLSIPSYPPGYQIVPLNQGSDPALDSNNPAGTLAALKKGQTDPRFDFGFLQDSSKATLGDRIWNDLNGNGVQDGGESGLSGVQVELYRLGNDSPVATITTAANGTYLFTNLTPGEYRIRVIRPRGFQFMATGQSDPAHDNDVDASSYSRYVTLTGGLVNLELDGGLKPTPTAVTVVDFHAERGPDGVWLYWETGTEIDNLGFNLYALRPDQADFIQINASLIPSQSPGSLMGSSYAWLDDAADPQAEGHYILESVDIYGVTERFEATVTADRSDNLQQIIFLPSIFH